MTFQTPDNIILRMFRDGYTVQYIAGHISRVDKVDKMVAMSRVADVIATAAREGRL